MEASLLGHRAVACSMCLQMMNLKISARAVGRKWEKGGKSLRNSAKPFKICEKYGFAHQTDGLTVHNLNFPSNYDGKEDHSYFCRQPDAGESL